MSAVEPLYQLIGVHPKKLTKEQSILLDIALFSYICEELKNIARENYKTYFYLIKLETEKENTMFEINLERWIINDILSTKEYSLQGIAYYTDTPPDVIEEVMIGYNTRSSGIFLRKIIELHRSVRRELYSEIMKNVIAQYKND